MNTRFSLLGKQFELLRFPPQVQHPSWQAWDAADELLIEHVASLPAREERKMLILNDDFGSLCCWFAAEYPCWVSDSYIARRACQQNLQNNNLAVESVTFMDSLQPLPQGITDVVMKVPKTLALLEQQLIALQPVINAETRIVAGGKANAIPKSMLAMFEKYIGPTHTSLAKKKARLIFTQPDNKPPVDSPYPTVWYTESPQLKITNHANVFSRQQFDIGARFLLQHLPDCSNKRIVDLGCGNGILGLHVLHRTAQKDRACEVLFFDESYMAIESAKQNVLDNVKGQMDKCQFSVGNCLDTFSQLADASPVDLVLCNPPFHQKNTITDHIALQMVKDAKQHLKKGGELRLVGNSHLGYGKVLKKVFGGCTTVASNRKFSILSAIKR